MYRLWAHSFTPKSRSKTDSRLSIDISIIFQFTTIEQIIVNEERFDFVQ